MQRDEIIEMARQAGFSIANAIVTGGTTDIQRFAKLVEAKEREACAKVCEELAELSRISDSDSMWEWGECASAIRARGNV